MIACPICGQENPEGFRFCGSCGAELAAEAATRREVRKTVTVLFCDLAGYTSKGESLDPEALRRVQSRYFEDARTALERHGATVEKFIGDAVMAVFGIPQLHEDDALRAVRAAVELRQAVDRLELQARIGVNTGEVVAGSGDALVTGDAVNVAARLEQAAPPGEILIGEETQQLCRDAIRAEPVEPLAAKGKSEPVGGYRLLEVLEGVPAFARRLDAPMIGRGDELAQLGQAYTRAVRERRCHLFTVLGPAGVGKSRLAHELGAALAGEARLLSGRCLSYGEGITYWPLVEIFRGAGAEGRLTTALEAATAEETFLAVRRFLEEIAREQPLVCVLDDLQWAEPTFLDFVEHVADWSRDAPILLVCLARAELLEARPAWGGGKVNAATILLEPLGESECDALIDALLAARLPEDVRRKIVETAGGNPLYVEQMLAMIVEGGDGEVTVPPTIQALVAARLDGLPVDERGVIERASVIGREFEQAALAELAPEGVALDACLLGLVRKELVQPRTDADGFRFAHQLVRDAAYEAMPKELRAELHERFAAWLERIEEVPERDEIVGYHLEQAYRYGQELGATDDETDLRRRAAERLAQAGRRALGRGDVSAVANLLGRSASLLQRDDPARLALLPDLGIALFDTGDLVAAIETLSEARARAQETGDRVQEAYAAIRLARVESHSEPEKRPIADLIAEAERSIPVFEQFEDHVGLAQAWHIVGLGRFWLGQSKAGAEGLERSIVHARRGGAVREEGESLQWLAIGEIYGPTPAQEGIRRCEEIIDRAAGRLSVEGVGLISLGLLQAMRGLIDEGRELVARGREQQRELGLRVVLGGTSMPAGMLELVADDPIEAERVLREGYDLLEQVGERGMLSTIATFLAESLYRQGRYEEAERYATAAKGAGGSDDLETQSRWRGVTAKVLARRGEAEPAELLAREAVALVDGTDWLIARGDLRCDLAEVLGLNGKKEEEAARSFEQALALYERKGNVVDAERVRALLVELRGNQPPATA